MTTSNIVRRSLIAMIDTETTNSIEQPVAYQIALAIIDREGNVYEKVNFLIREVFFGMADLMKSAYYANKIPEYYEQIERGEIEVVSLTEAVLRIREMLARWNCRIWCAYNSGFDFRAMNTTQRYLTKSKYRYLLPYNMEAWDALEMVKSVVAKTPSYIKFCEENGFMTKHKKPRVQVKAETVYRYITKDTEFIEEHKAAEDVEIEAQILAYCFRKHKKMNREATFNRK